MKKTLTENKLRSLSLLFFFSLCLFGHTVSAQSKVSINLQNVDLKVILEEIQRKTDYQISYQGPEVEEISGLSLNVQNQAVTAVLDQCLKGTGLSYSIVGTKIVVGNIVKGKVLDEEGYPLPGASVLLKGTRIGTSTLGDGTFSVMCPDCNSNSILVVSFIGMHTQEIKLGNSRQLSIALEPEDKTLNEVVVTGYGKRSIESYTGAAVTVEGEELIQTNSTNVLSALQTLEPSFVMIENLEMGSDPNLIPDFEIRGSSALPKSTGLETEYTGSPNMPLFVLDGFETTATVIFDLDPQRIKSATILKDASATAIYGSRGANGVVVIETHAPKQGSMLVRYSLDLTLEEPDLTSYDLLNAAEKLELEKESNYYLHYSPDTSVGTREEAMNNYNEILKQVERGVDTYWLSQPLKRALSQKHSLFFEGGSEAMRYAISTMYNDSNGVMKESGRDTYNIGVNLQYNVKNFTFKNNLTYDHIVSQNSPYGSFDQYAKLNPYWTPTDENGNLVPILGSQPQYGFRYNVFNPLYNASLNVKDETRTNRFRNNFSADWTLTKASTLRGSFSIEQGTGEGEIFKPGNHTDFVDQQDFNRRGSYTHKTSENLTVEGKITYQWNKKIEKHLFYASSTAEMRQEESSNYTFVAEGFNSEKLDDLLFAMQYKPNDKPRGTKSIARSIGLLGTANYSYDNRYFGDLSFRTDASSRFGKNSRWAPFWSAGLGWNMHHEDFLKEINFINQLKLRASYGVTGSQNFNPYQAMTTYRFYDATRYQYGYGFTMIGMGNNDLEWQKTTKTNIGLDARLWKGLFSFTADFYNELTKDSLVPINLALSLGFPNYMANLGEIQNRGFELKLRSQVFNRDQMNLSVFASLIHNKNTLRKLSSSLQSINEANEEAYYKEEGNISSEEREEIRATKRTPTVRYIEGESANTIWAVPSLGIDPATGKEIFLTRDGEKTTDWSANNLRAIGTTDPDFQGNFGATFFYKGFQLNTTFNYRVGGQRYNSTLVAKVENANKNFNVDQRVFDDRWRNPGDISFFKDIKDGSVTRPTSRFVEDDNWLKVSSLNLSYTFNSEVLERLKLSRLKLILSTNDLFHLSSIAMERGTNYPFARTFRGSVQVTF